MKPKKAQKKKYVKNEKRSSNASNEIISVAVFAAGILMLLSFFFEKSIGLFGEFIRETILGIIGLPGFLIPPVIIAYSIIKLIKKNDNNIINKKLLYSVILLVLMSALLQTGLYRSGDYVNLTFTKALDRFYRDGTQLAGGGILGGMLSYPLLLIFQTVGTIIILATLSIIDIILLTNASIAGFFKNIALIVKERRKKKIEKAHTLNEEEKQWLQIEDMEDEPALRVLPRNKIIDFKIEKNSRELRENTSSLKVPEYEENIKEDPDALVLSDIEEKKVKKLEKKEQNIPAVIPDSKSTGVYKFPPLSLLAESKEGARNTKIGKNPAVEGAKKLEETLSSFGVAAKVINVSKGPTVTRYELQPSAGVKVSRIVSLADDISLNLAASGVRIEAPIPGKAAIGIEVPNKEITVVTLRDVLDSDEFSRHNSKLAAALGQDITGECIVADLARMPHLLIAGATGSGKSVCINSLIISIIYKASPDEVKLLMIDPKVVELGVYNGIPHLLIPVVTDPKKAASALNWAVQEMTERYKLFAEKGVRDIKGYNEALKGAGEPALPQILIIIDELADLMMVAPNEVEDSICRLAQMARAAGMHIVIATQRPSVDVITGVIKANIPSRISFAVSSQIDSRTILDMAGAEKLMGRGDMLFYPVGKPKPIRVQGAFVTDEEVERVVEYVKAQGTTEYNPDIIEEINSESDTVQNSSEDKDELLTKAIDLVVDAGQASVSLIQRKFKVGYARAARIIDQMEARGIVGGFEGSKPRQILITKQQWHELKMADDK